MSSNTGRTLLNLGSFIGGLALTTYSTTIHSKLDTNCTSSTVHTCFNIIITMGILLVVLPVISLFCHMGCECGSSELTFYVWLLMFGILSLLLSITGLILYIYVKKENYCNNNDASNFSLAVFVCGFILGAILLYSAWNTRKTSTITPIASTITPITPTESTITPVASITPTESTITSTESKSKSEKKEQEIEKKEKSFKEEEKRRIVEISTRKNRERKGEERKGGEKWGVVGTDCKKFDTEELCDNEAENCYDTREECSRMIAGRTALQKKLKGNKKGKKKQKKKRR